MTPEQETELREWFLSRPPSIKEAILKFPPGCMVRATVPLGVPAPGYVGEVVSYIESGADGRTGCRVRGRWQGMGPFTDAHCNIDDLELVEEGVVTREIIERFLHD